MSDITDEKLLRRVLDLEDGWTERKPKGVSTEDIRREVVSFANSLPENEDAVLFIGVEDDGLITGVDESNKRQRNIRTAIEGCYPPITFTCRSLNIESKEVIAVLVRANFDRPHFTGQAYVRVGSETLKASVDQFAQLIASRMSKARRLLEAKHNDEKIALNIWPNGRADRVMGGTPLRGAKVIDVNQHFATFSSVNISGTQKISSNYDRLEFTWDHSIDALQVDIDSP